MPSWLSGRASTWSQYHLAKFEEFSLDVRDPVVLSCAWVAQLVERILGKNEVSGSIPDPGSRRRSKILLG